MPVPEKVEGSDIELREWEYTDAYGARAAGWGAYQTYPSDPEHGYFLYRSWSKAQAARMTVAWRKNEQRRREQSAREQAAKSAIPG